MGAKGEGRAMVDSRGKEVDKLDQKKPVPGRPIRLTLDYDVQLAAEQALAGRQGAVVALDPRTGDILAMVSHPGFDPTLFATRIPPEQWGAVSAEPAQRPLYRALHDP